MKTIPAVLLVLCAAAFPGNAQVAPTATTAPSLPISSAAALAAIPSTPDGYSVTEIGANYRRWTRQVTVPYALGNPAYLTNSYVELQDSMYYVRRDPPDRNGPRAKLKSRALPAVPSPVRGRSR